MEYEINNTGQTIFHIASVSKQFTGFAIAMLADQGKISMQDDIRKYIPELPDYGTPITLNHLVHHTSGLRDQWNLLGLAGWRLDDVITHDQIMRLLCKQRELNFQPGEEMVYCNTGFTLLAEVVHRVTGQSFPAWTKENIFMPLEMKSTLFYDDHEMIVPNRAYSYRLQDTVMKKSVLSYANVGATSLFTTVDDLAKWTINFDSIKVGNAGIMEKMEERFILNRGDTMSYGYGQGIGKYKGLKTVSHGGADAGYRTMLLRFPEQHFTVIVFSNLANFSSGGMSFVIADAYLSELYVEEPKKEEEPPAPEAKEEVDLSKIRLSDYQGRFYSDELEIFYDFEVINDTLIAHHQRHDDVKLTAQAIDKFNSNRWWMGNLSFTRSAANKVTGFEANSGRVRGLKFRKLTNKF
jgi:CubicO group peptidase (beta-lactamase class C family)